MPESLTVNGFDPDGEPTITTNDDGSLWIHFEAMPPFFAEDDGTEDAFDDFEVQLQAALGVPVIRDDRELFIVQAPNPDTAARAKAWLEGFHNNHA